MKLDPYQQEALEFAKACPDASALLLGCGLGKTAISVRYVEDVLENLESKGVLIVAPRRPALVVWPLELERWAPWIRYEVLRGPTMAEQLRNDAHVYLVNYEILQYGGEDARGLVPELKKIPTKLWPFDQIIWDELTWMKSNDSKRLKAMLPVIKRMSKRLGLTGTIITKNYMDLWGQYAALDGGKRLGDNFYRFRQKHFYLPDPYRKYDWHLLPGAKEQIEEAVADISITMESADHLDIPPCTQEIVELELPAALKDQYDEFEREAFIELDAAEIEAPSRAVLCGKLLQFTAGSIYYKDEAAAAAALERGEDLKKMPRGVKHVHDIKLKAAKKIIDRHRKAGEPILVAYGYQHECERFLKMFPDAVHLKSGLSLEQERDLQRRWDAGEIPILLCHPASAGHGLNMQYGGHVALWLTPTYDYDLDHQFCCRIDRRGQTHPTTIYRLIMKDTIDEAVMSCIETKAESRSEFIRVLKKYRNSKKDTLQDL